MGQLSRMENEPIDDMIDEIKENRIMAKFVGLKVVYIQSNHYQDPIEYELEIHEVPNFLDHDEDLLHLYESDGPVELYYEFHSNWNWLMGVVEMIENLRGEDKSYLFSFDIGRDYCVIKHNDFMQEMIAVSSVHEDKIMSIYKAIIRFIEWYNKQDIKLMKG